jgi:arginine/ornithine transport system permease protein
MTVPDAFLIIGGYLDLYARGLLTTVRLVALSCVGGLLLALPLALMGSARRACLRWPAASYIFCVRGTPLLAQLFLIYYGVAQLGFVRHSLFWRGLQDAYWCACLSFVINTSAYTAEILRGAIEATPPGEIEAAQAVGLTRWLTYRRIILPSAARRALPAYGNEVIFMLHASAIASVITVVDITGAAKIVSTRTYSVFAAYLTAALLYLCLTLLLVWLFRRIERRWNKHLRYIDVAAAAGPGGGAGQLLR